MVSSDHASEYRDNTMNSGGEMPPPENGVNEAGAPGGDSMQVIEDAYERQIMEQMNKDREVEKQYQKTAFIIPSCAAWFEFSTIHELEM